MPILLQKRLCDSGIVKTFREADELISNRWVKVNDRPISSMLFMVSENDTIAVKKGKKADWTHVSPSL